MRIAYIRVSTKEQHEERQIETLKKYDIEKTYLEKVSGKNTSDRTKLNEMLDFCREGDAIYIADLSRLARNLKDLLSIVEYLENKGVALVSAKESIDTGSATGKMMLSMLGAVYEFERSVMHERQSEGIKIAQEQGRYAGRKAVNADDIEFEEYYTKYLNREIKTKTELAYELNISRPTLDKLIRQYQEEHEAA